MKIDYSFKIVNVGSSGVGKTSLIRRYTDNRFEETYIETLGVEFAVKRIQLQEYNVELKLFDTAGEERFGPLRPYYYRGAHGVIVIFDTTRRSTFDRVAEWINQVYINCGTIPCILVGNKIDLKNRVVSTSEAEKHNKNKNLQYMESSAKTGDNVEHLFTNLSKQILMIEK